MRRLTAALETAIGRVELISLRQQESRAVQCPDGLIQDPSKVGSQEVRSHFRYSGGLRGAANPIGRAP